MKDELQANFRDENNIVAFFPKIWKFNIKKTIRSKIFLEIYFFSLIIGKKNEAQTKRNNKSFQGKKYPKITYKDYKKLHLIFGL